MGSSDGNYPRIRNNEHLGVNKIGKSIRKSPLHETNFANAKQNQNTQQHQQPQPQVYNISKNDFRSIVQQLTGSPSHHDSPAPVPLGPRHNAPKPSSMRLQKIRPPPLTPIARPTLPPPVPAPPPAAHFGHNSINQNSNPNPPFFGRLPGQMSPMLPIAAGDPTWSNLAESPISAYMRYLQSSMLDSTGSKSGGMGQSFGNPSQGGHPLSSGLLPMPPAAAPVLPPPRGGGPAGLPSPSSQYLLPSPSSFLNLVSPRSPYSPLSPGFQYPPLSPRFQFSPLTTPNFALSPMPPQGSGILGPGPGPGPQQPPLSPGFFFPLSPSGLFPFSSPRWRE